MKTEEKKVVEKKEPEKKAVKAPATKKTAASTKKAPVKKAPAKKASAKKAAPVKKATPVAPKAPVAKAVAAPAVAEKKIAAPKANTKERDLFACYYNAFQRYFDFKGRTSRYGYWSFIAINTLVALVISCFVLGGIPALDAVYSLIVLIPSWAISVRRMHDVNKSGWWVGGALIGAIIVGAMNGFSANHPSNILSTATLVCAVILLAVALYIFVLSFFKGTKGSNKYGDEPTV